MGRSRLPAMKTLAVLALLSTADILVWSHRQKRQDGELGLSKEGFPASKQVADGVYSFSNDGFYMSMFVVTSEGVMVVDPMNRNQATAMLAEIRNITQAPIRYLFLSHNHYDHIKGAQVFKDEGASVISHIEAYQYIEANPTTDVILPDQTWSGGRRDFTLGGVTMELHYLGLSHGLGMTSFLLQPQKVGYIADNSVPNGLPFVFLPDYNIKGLENTLRTYMSYDVEQIIFSHSNLEDPLTPGSKDNLQFWLDYIKELRDAVNTEIQNGGNAFALDIQLPKYENLPFYKEWLPLNALMVAMNEFLGPLGWRPTNQELKSDVESDVDTRNSIDSDISSGNSIDSDLPLRSSIFSPVPPKAPHKSPSESPAPVFSPSSSSIWPARSYSWRMLSSPHHSSLHTKWKNYLNSRGGSNMWG